MKDIHLKLFSVNAIEQWKLLDSLLEIVEETAIYVHAYLIAELPVNAYLSQPLILPAANPSRRCSSFHVVESIYHSSLLEYLPPDSATFPLTQTLLSRVFAMSTGAACTEFKIERLGIYSTWYLEQA